MIVKCMDGVTTTDDYENNDSLRWCLVTYVVSIHCKEHEAKPLDNVTRGRMSLQNVEYIVVKPKCGVHNHFFGGPDDCGHPKRNKLNPLFSKHVVLLLWCLTTIAKKEKQNMQCSM